MMTAREKLYEEMVAMIAVAAGPTSEAELRKVMTRYRVQTKPGVNVSPATTARDALGERLLELWRGQAPDAKAKIGTAIDEFRMQLKGAAPPPPQKLRPLASPSMQRLAVPALEDDDRGRRAREQPSARRDPAGNTAAARAGANNAPVAVLAASDPPTAAMRSRSSRGGAEPVAGGPRKRGRTRAECPKCHSMGVVLARSYSGDEYFSCIYCGWQAYKPAEEDDPNASLAVRLLGQSPAETTRD